MCFLSDVLFCVCSYMCFRLVGSALPFLSVPQLRLVLSSEVMRHYGEHVMVAQVGQNGLTACGHKVKQVKQFDLSRSKSKTFLIL